MAKHNKKGRSLNFGQFAPMPYNLLKSEAWRSLKGSSVKVFLELRARYNGHNNGDLSLSYAEAARILGIGKSTVKSAYAELTEKGLLRRSSPGSWYGRKAATWALTMETLDIPNHQAATNAWKNWAKKQKPVR